MSPSSSSRISRTALITERSFARDIVVVSLELVSWEGSVVALDGRVAAPERDMEPNRLARSLLEEHDEG